MEQKLEEVWVLIEDVGEYSDRIIEMLGVYKTKEEARQAAIAYAKSSEISIESEELAYPYYPDKRETWCIQIGEPYSRGELIVKRYLVGEPAHY